MIRIIKIVSVHEGGKRTIERPEYLTFLSKDQMEIYRNYLTRTTSAVSVYFNYEEH